jgi:hypothetical protein
VNGYPHVSAVLLPVEERRVSTGEALEPVWMLWRRQISCPAGNWT